MAREYRSQVAAACWAHATADSAVALVMYDLTTLYFEISDEDRLRKVGMSNYADVRVMPMRVVAPLRGAVSALARSA